MHYMTDNAGISYYKLGGTTIIDKDGTEIGQPTEEQQRGIDRLYDILKKAGKTGNVNHQMVW